LLHDETVAKAPPRRKIKNAPTTPFNTQLSLVVFDFGILTTTPSIRTEDPDPVISDIFRPTWKLYMEQQEISEKVCLFAGYVCVTGFRNGFPVELQITDVQQDNTSKKTTGDARISCGTWNTIERVSN